jgi:predicted alternative tryptophan synthase beta-subunit
MSGITIDITSLKQAESEAKRYRYQLEKAQEIARLGYGEYNYKTGDFFGLIPFINSSDLTMSNLNSALEIFMNCFHLKNVKNI